MALLLLANHSEKTWEWKGETYTCQPGQFITSLDNIKKLCSKKTTIKNIRTALNKFARWQFLANESTKTGRLITIINWELYQGDDFENGEENVKERAKSGQRAGRERASNKNVKNVKNVKNKDIGEKRKRFVPPTFDEVAAYCNERKNTINPQAFIDWYESNGWMIGKNKMKDWKASIRTWEQRGGNNGRYTGSASHAIGKAKSDKEQYPVDFEG